MLLTDSEVHIGLSLAGSIEGGLHQVLIDRCACPILIVVEQQQSLGKPAILQALLTQHAVHHGLVFASLDELVNTLSASKFASLVKLAEECEFVDVVEIGFLERRRWHVVVGRKEGEHILEHAACRTGSRYELHDVASCSLVFLPSLHILFTLLLVGSNNALANGSSGLQFEEWETSFELFQLSGYLLLSDSF